MATRRDPEVLDQVRDFYRSLPEDSRELGAFNDAMAVVVEKGPTVGRPLVAEISLEPDFRMFLPTFGRHLKELRPLGTDIRVLCTYDPNRTLVLLYAGDKAGDWNRWYRTAIAEAARLYAAYRKDTGA